MGKERDKVERRMNNINLLLGGLLIGVMFGFFLHSLNKDVAQVTIVDLTEYKQYKVGCGSDSMGLLLSCGDIVLGEEVNKLYLGNLYVFNKKSQTVVHRLISCLDKDCSKVIMKGDNNKVGEIVSRDDILAEVVGVYYGGREE